MASSSAQLGSCSASVATLTLSLTMNKTYRCFGFSARWEPTSYCRPFSVLEKLSRLSILPSFQGYVTNIGGIGA